MTDTSLASVASRHDTEKNSVLVEIHDEGVGICAEDLTRIRTPFFTTQGTSGGTGLGLYVSDAIIQEHRGSLTFRSKKGEGTTAMISLPAEGAE